MLGAIDLSFSFSFSLSSLFNMSLSNRRRFDSDLDGERSRKKGRMSFTGSGGGRGRYNALTMVSFSELYMNQELDERRSCPLPTGPGVGPSPFAEQGVRVVTCMALEDLNIRAKHPEESVFGNWVPNVDPNHAYSIQKSEILCRIINSEEYTPRWMDGAQGNKRRMYPQVFSSFTNFKEEYEYSVVGAARNPGAGRGQVDNINDKSVACQIGGTITLPNSGQFRIHPGDHLYYMREAWTSPVDLDDPFGREGFNSMCPMKGIHPSKRLGTLIPLGPHTITQYINNQYTLANRNLNRILFNDYSKDARNPVPRKVPKKLEVQNFLEVETARMSDGVQGKIPQLILLVQIHTLQEILSKCESHALMSHVNANNSGVAYEDVLLWKKLAGEVMVLLADLLKQHFSREAQHLPHHLSNVAWQRRLPIVIDYKYEADKAFEIMPKATRQQCTHIEHIKSGSKIVTMELVRGINGKMSQKFVGTALSGADPNCPVDTDLKRI